MYLQIRVTTILYLPILKVYALLGLPWNIWFVFCHLRLNGSSSKDHSILSIYWVCRKSPLKTADIFIILKIYTAFTSTKINCHVEQRNLNVKLCCNFNAVSSFSFTRLPYAKAFIVFWAFFHNIAPNNPIT